jgi:hypothetical protein
VKAREGSRERGKGALIGICFRWWRCSSFERSKPFREPVLCGPDNCLLYGQITVWTKPVHGAPFVASVATFGLEMTYLAGASISIVSPSDLRGPSSCNNS